MAETEVNYRSSLGFVRDASQNVLVCRLSRKIRVYSAMIVQISAQQGGRIIERGICLDIRIAFSTPLRHAGIGTWSINRRICATTEMNGFSGDA